MINTDDCWLWAKIVNWADYGVIQLKIDGVWRERRAHRLVYEALVGEIPEGLVLDHLCITPRCINPEHLEPVTNRVNTLRGVGITAQQVRAVCCKNGHAWTPDNTYYRKTGGRRCKACNVITRRNNRHKNV